MHIAEAERSVFALRAMLARAGKAIKLIGVEKNPAGIADARLNAELNGLGRIRVLDGNHATEFLRDAARSGTHVDVVALDPPRLNASVPYSGCGAWTAAHRLYQL